MDITITASAVAWYGAVVATVGFVLSSFLALRDRARLIVKASTGYRVTSAVGGYDPFKLYILVTLANSGRRTVTVEKVWLEMKTKPHSLLADSFRHGPTELAEGKSATFLLEQENVELSRVKRVVALDQTGRKWPGDLEAT